MDPVCELEVSKMIEESWTSCWTWSRLMIPSEGSDLVSKTTIMEITNSLEVIHEGTRYDIPISGLRKTEVGCQEGEIRIE